MSQNEVDYHLICPNSILCSENLCQLQHQRAYLGLCIVYLQMQQDWANQKTILAKTQIQKIKEDDQENSEEEEEEEEFKEKKCKNQKCQLWHLKKADLKHFLKVDSSIYGIFPNNLCKQLNCEKKQECIFIHKEWAKNLCIQDIIKECQKKENKKCKLDHLTWDDVKKKAEKFSKIQFTNPELLCMKKECTCDNHPEDFSKYCIPYLKGWCPKKNCDAKHVNWEQVEIKQIKHAPCTNLQHKSSQTLDEINQLREIQIQCEQVQLHRFKQQLQKSNTIDVIFIMDLTGSMNPWKDEIQSTISNIIREFQQSIKGYSVRVGFVGYRDVCDLQEQISYRNLTHNINSIIEYISRLEAKGGGDEAEDIVGGFVQAMKLNISRNPDSLLCTFLIADSPCHGKQYHDLESDDYLDQVPDNYLEDTLLRYKNIKKNNFLCCVKINETTNKMFDKMKLAFPLITITTKKQPKELSELVQFTLHQSLKQSKLIPQDEKKKEYFQATFQQFKLDNQSKYNDENKAEFWENFAENILKSSRTGQTGLEIQLDNPEFISNDDDNYTTSILKAFDARNNQFIIIKFPKVILKNFQQNKIDNQEIQKAELLAESRFYSSSYAFQMAYFFNCESYKLEDIPLIFYVLPTLYQLEKPLYGMTKIYGETFIDTQFLFQKYSDKNIKFQKYTTNFYGSNQEFYYYSVFSHFSYIESKGLFVITDLQGYDNIFTDPSIQTKKNRIKIQKNGQSIYILDVDNTNQNQRGIDIFLQQQHKDCSVYCTQLQLSREGFAELTNVDQSVWKEQQHISGICHLCNQFAEIDLEEKQINQMGFYLKCQICLNEQSYLSEQLCKCCQKLFNTEVQIKARIPTILEYCGDCKNMCKENNSKCFYCQKQCKKLLSTITIQQKLISICKNGLQYLKSLKCYKCGQQYNYDNLISQQEYNSGVYLCCDNQ
ncbi:unnamed protein product [Paramecium sonneborni]|uniref:Alpha-type protein kinase domain-containing protein n=1 Tax=Paramecium sonneborni TaxID=65129 RepID=A0A8S1LN35_9CILI|nr:unnamed protein product [Paramecium sonneborni]